MDGVIVTEQDAVGVVPGTSVQVPEAPKSTVPVGVIGVPAVEVSLTVAVHVTDCPTTTVVGVHVTEVDDVLVVTVIVV